MFSSSGSFSVVSYGNFGVFFQEGILSDFQFMVSVNLVSVLCVFPSLSQSIILVFIPPTKLCLGVIHYVYAAVLNFSCL